MSSRRVINFLLTSGTFLVLSYSLWFYFHGSFIKRLNVVHLHHGSGSALSVKHSALDTKLAVGNESLIPNLTYDFVILDYMRYQLQKTDFVVKNCLVTQNRNLTSVANAIAIATRKLRRLKDLPNGRRLWQRWVWILDESPYHSVDGQPFHLSDLNNVFNWTMTYRRDSDVYIPYGWTTRKDQSDPDIPNLGKRNGLIASVISNCGSFYVHNHRMEYVKELNKTAKVTLYGRCGKPCEGYKNNQQGEPCPEIRKFLFYLSFENANCKEYITEKLFGNAFHMGAVPIVMGADREEYAHVAPPNSFIHVKDFASPQKLGEYVLSLSKNITEYMKYHEWRKHYSTDYRIQFVVRKGVWGPLCDKLNRDKGDFQTVSNLEQFWSVRDCDSEQL